jgi:hypothetical protein
MRTSKVTISEHQIQSAFFKIVAMQERVYPMLKIMFAVPNAAKRSMALASMLKAEGMRSGVPDVMFPYNNGKYNGLALEFKSAKGKPTENQLLWIASLQKYGWDCYIVNNSESAWNYVLDYIKNK